MTPIEYLDAAKVALKITSDYELAKRLEVDNRRISAYRKGREKLDNYIATKLAITLQIDPAQVIADLEYQNEKDEKKREFWKGFLSRAAITAVLACTLALNFSGISESGASLAGGLAVSIFGILAARRPRILGNSGLYCWPTFPIKH